jgi:hypothetical protein
MCVFTNAWRPKEDNVLGAIDERERLQRVYGFLIERRLRIEFERVETFEHRKVRELRANGDASFLPRGDLSGKKMIGELQRREASLVSSLNVRLERAAAVVRRSC